jgi:ABC-type uncharacterized transport system permease subunit
MTTFFAMLISLPLGLGAAIYLSEYASQSSAAASLKPILEVLAGMPDRGIWLFCTDLYDTFTTQHFWCRYSTNLQHFIGRTGNGNHDPTAGEFDE